MFQRVLKALTVWLALGIFASAAEPRNPVFLISLDGFRWDYADLHPAETPTIRRLKQEGVSAQGLIPVFPSNTFPNHYTIVTGLYPARHGIINNRMFDPTTGEFFSYNVPSSSLGATWWGGEPIWITAVKQGKVSACSYWPGSEVKISGRQATYWRPFDYFKITFEKRLEFVANWFRRPVAEWPAVCTFYIEEINGLGHDYGPDSPELIAGLKVADAQIATLIEQLTALGVTANYVLVSDHGMTNVAPERLLILDDYIDLATVQTSELGSSASLRPLDTPVGPLLAALEKIPHAKVYRAEDLPAHFHLKDNKRIAPIWVLPEEGWRIVARATAKIPQPRTGRLLRGDHGYDPARPNMHGLFVARGPAFQRGVQLPAVENIHIYNLLCAVAGLQPAPNDGDDRLVKAALRP